jgi:hypothetical protein
LYHEPGSRGSYTRRVLILPPGHAQAIRVPHRFSVREKWAIGTVLAGVAALTVALVIALATNAAPARKGCIDVTIAYVVGAQELKHCGAEARTLCLQAGVPGGFAPESARAVAAACRKAGIAVGR